MSPCSYSSHLIKPLDVSVFGPLKTEFDRVAAGAGLVRGDLVVGKIHFSNVLKYVDIYGHNKLRYSLPCTVLITYRL